MISRGEIMKLHTPFIGINAYETMPKVLANFHFNSGWARFSNLLFRPIKFHIHDENTSLMKSKEIQTHYSHLPNKCGKWYFSARELTKRRKTEFVIMALEAHSKICCC